MLYNVYIMFRTLPSCIIMMSDISYLLCNVFQFCVKYIVYRIYSNSSRGYYSNFALSSVRLLIEGGYYLFRARAIIDTAARMRYVYILTCTYAGQLPTR